MFSSIILVFNADCHILSILADYKTSPVSVKLHPPQATSSDKWFYGAMSEVTGKPPLGVFGKGTTGVRGDVSADARLHPR